MKNSTSLLTYLQECQRGEANSNTSNNAQSGDTSDTDQIRVAEEVAEENTSTTTTATVHSTEKEMSISELFARLSAQSISKEDLKQSTQEVKQEIKEMKEAVDKEFADIGKEVGEVKEDTAKMVNEKNQELKDMMNLQRQNLQEQIDALRNNDTSAKEREVTVIGLENPEPTPPAIVPRSITKEDMSDEAKEYLIQSLEDEAIVRSVEWLYRQLETDHQTRKMDILQPVLNVQQPRNTILTAIYNFKQQVITTEGAVVWDRQESANSKSGQAAIAKLTASVIPLAQIEDGMNVTSEIKTATASLLTHMETLKATFRSLTKSNRDNINMVTSGTLSVPPRQLSVIMDTVPNFSGDSNQASWLDFQIAVQPLQLHNFNKKDSVLQFLKKIMPPAARIITTKDRETTVMDIFKKLKAIHGTPSKVCLYITEKHS